MNLLRLLIVPFLALTLNVVVSSGTIHATTTSNAGAVWGQRGSLPPVTTSGVSTQTPSGYPGGPPGWYDINNWDAYCTGGGTDCYTGISCYFVSEYCGNMGLVQAIGSAAGATYGTPGFVSSGCYLQTADGGFVDGGVSVETAAFSALWDDYYRSTYSEGNSTFPAADIGTISGKGTLLSAQTDDTSEDLSQATSSLSFSAYDPYTDVIVTVTGVQNTDNGNDTLNGGSFSITVHGTHTTGSTGLYNTDTESYYTGTLHCQAGGPNTSTLGTYEGATNAPNCFYGSEGELEDYPFHDWNQYVYWIARDGLGECLFFTSP